MLRILGTSFYATKQIKEFHIIYLKKVNNPFETNYVVVSLVISALCVKSSLTT